VPVVSSFHYLLGPIVAAAALGILVLICRWVFSTDHRSTVHRSPDHRSTVLGDRSTRRRDKALTTRDYGLLVPLATVRTREDADMLRDLLRDAGIRAGISDDLELLVFSKDLSRARALVSTP